jgi:hypothetical protein
MKAEIYSALSTDAVLTSLLADGADSVFQMHPQEQARYPCISFYRLGENDTFYVDDEAVADRYSFMIDIWSKEETDIIKVEVARVMKALGFSKRVMNELYETDTGIYHLPIKFETTKTKA